MTASPPDAEPLRHAVETVIRERWVPPAPRPASFAVAPDKVPETARAVLDTMLTRQYRVTALPAEAEYAEMLRRVTHFVRKGRPVRIMLGYAPMKNPNTCRHARCDWAEFFALCHLCTWHNKVCGVYPPGLSIKIIFDDSTIRMANRHANEPMRAYMTSIARLIPALGYESFLPGTMRQSSFAWLFNFGLYQIAGWRVRKWERDPVNRETVEKMATYARRNLHVPPGLSEDEIVRRCGEAAHRYRVYWEALQLSGVSKLGNKLVAMYLDGDQHHIRQQAALHLTSLGKGQVTQPWQGEGALVDNGHGQLIPAVLTAARREKLQTSLVTGLSLLPLPGFDTLEVARDAKGA